MSKQKSQSKSKSQAKISALSKVKAKVNSRVKLSSNSNLLQPLVNDDLIDIVAPGSSTDLAILKKACAILQSWGYRTRVANDLMKPELFLSNSDSYRFESLKKALLANDSKAVWCLRGGYGSIRLLPFLNQLKKPKHQKLLIGLSDITTLQIFLQQKWNWPSIHGPLLDRIGLENLPETNRTELKNLLEGKLLKSEFAGLKPLNLAAKKAKRVEGLVTGGNLMVATSTLGTVNQLDADNKILFLEELSERGYRIDRCLQQLKQAGIFSSAKAVVLGDFLKCLEPDGSDLSFQTLQNFFETLKVPAFFNVPLGHGTEQRPLVFNTKATITSMAIDHSRFTMVVFSPYEVYKPRK